MEQIIQLIKDELSAIREFYPDARLTAKRIGSRERRAVEILAVFKAEKWHANIPLHSFHEGRGYEIKDILDKLELSHYYPTKL
ncbi:MAG: hypothetical protein UH850_12565 [Paludibacteraceae bacterium]|nr:hypothetical protein [Paludibacteraceae bacterium]